MSEESKPRTIQIAPDAQAHVRISRRLEGDVPGEDTRLETVHEFDVSRNVTMGLLPKLEETLKDVPELDMACMEITISLSGKNPDTGDRLEMPIYDGFLTTVLELLRSRVVTNDQAIMASTSFFQDMFDMVDLKAVLMVAVFGKGQASYVLTNRTVEVDNTHMLRLIATTLMQLDKLKDHMAKNGFEMPGANKLVLPGDPGFGPGLPHLGG